MTSTSKEPSGRDRPGNFGLDNDRLDIRGAQPEQHKRGLPEGLSATSFEQPSTAGGGTDVGALLADLPVVEPPPSVSVGPGPVPSGVAPRDDGSDTAGQAAARDFIDVGVSDAQDLRRLEESIRWLMSAGTKPMPRRAPLPSVLGLTPLDADDDDSLLLDPDTLFPPRPRHHANTVVSAAKILLVSAIAAPTAYFIASWLQLPGAAATSDATVVATSVGLSDDQSARTSVLSDAAPPQAVHDDVNVITKTPGPPAISRVVMATAVAAPAATTPERLPVVTPPEAVTAPTPAILPAKPAMPPQEIAMMIERGRVLFEAGDVAAARLFFRRAANAGDPAAAIAMGATYDPEILAQRFIRGIEANAEEAQKWYDKAREMSQHVEMLAQRH
jgi:hypothetical protein